MINRNPYPGDLDPLCPVIIVDVPVTKRKYMAFIYRSPGEMVFAGQGLEDALRWLRENEWQNVDLISPTGRWTLEYHKPLEENEVDLWLGQLPHS